MKRTRKLSRDLIVGTAVNRAITTATVIVLITFILVNFIEDEQRVKNQAIADSIAFQIESYFTEPVEVLYEIRDVIITEHLIEKDAYQVFIDAILQNNERLSSILILNHDGMVIHSSPMNPRVINTDQSSYPYFYHAINDSVHWSRAFHSYRSKYPVVGVSIAFGEDILVGILNTEELSDLIQSINIGEGNLISVTDERGLYIAHSIEELVFQRENYDNYDALLNTKQMYQEVEYLDKKYVPSTVILEDRLWSVSVFQLHQNIMRPLYSVVVTSLLLLSLILSISVYLSIRKSSHISHMIEKLVTASKELAGGSYDHDIESGEYEELNQLAEQFNVMTHEINGLTNNLENLVEERTDQLRVANESLNDTIVSLNQTQDRLVKAEKITATAQLVSGIAHEINTPLGVGITSISYLDEGTKDVYERLMNGDLSKVQLTTYFDAVNETVGLVSRSLFKASNLVETFKLLSVANDESEWALFDVNGVIEDSLKYVKSKHEYKHLSIDLKLTSQVYLYGRSKDFSQILYQLIDNIYVHAYKGQNRGRVEICTWIQEKSFILTVADEGVGVDIETEKRMFDPFYTTSREDDGVGLGLNIVSNIVHNVFDGNIEFESSDSGGVKFTIQLPHNPS